jgi:hypothetical protein
LGHGNNPDPPKPPAPDFVAAKEIPPVQTELQNQALKTLQWGAKGDYTNPHEGGLFINMADPAMLNRNNELMTNEAGQGIEGLGTADPNYLASVKENRKAHMAEDAAGKYENDIKAGMGAATGVATDMSSLSAQERQAILNAQTSSYNTQLAKPREKKWWEFLAGAGAAAAPSIIDAI